jgi:FkbH-like protein
MKLIDALAMLETGSMGVDAPLPVLLACGFEPLHLATFLTAHLQERFPQRPVRLTTGLYGDLAGTLERGAAGVEAVAAVIEWSDLDPRLGVRGLGAWSPRVLPDVVEAAERAAARIQAALERLAGACPVALCGPTLPLPPVAYTPGWQTSAFETDLADIVAGVMRWAVRHPRVRVVRAQRLDAMSPPGARLDVLAEVRAGFPYRPPHADAVGALLAALVEGPPPKKGLITDLDDTLWAGLLGEAGVAGVTWDLAAGGHLHAVYQRLLAALAESGVLVAVASKNDPALVEDALRRPDLLLARDRVHPVHAGWGPKSEAVGRILRAWNVAADSVVFVDDTPMELAEVGTAHPGITTVAFPRDDPAAAWATFERLRDLFGKTAITGEDRLRLASLRRREFAEPPADGGAGVESFLASAAAVVTLDARLAPDDPRGLELVNKTNQFTLNGRRYTEPQWRALLARPGAFLLRVSYEDRFGPLGTIAIVAGRVEGRTVTVDAWVMSCRSFSRRVEHQCLRDLFARFGADEIRLHYAKTERNGPLQAFLAGLLGTSLPGAGLVLTRAAFEAACPVLSHTIREASDDRAP